MITVDTDFAYWERRIVAIVIIPMLVRMVGGECPDHKMSELIDATKRLRQQAKVMRYTEALYARGKGPR